MRWARWQSHSDSSLTCSGDVRCSYESLWKDQVGSYCVKHEHLEETCVQLLRSTLWIPCREWRTLEIVSPTALPVCVWKKRWDKRNPCDTEIPKLIGCQSFLKDAIFGAEKSGKYTSKVKKKCYFLCGNLKMENSMSGHTFCLFRSVDLNPTCS